MGRYLGKRDWRRRGRDQPDFVQVAGFGAFGEAQVCELTPHVQRDFVYGAHADMLVEYTAGTGSISYANAMATISTGASAGGTAYLRSKRAVRYRPGQGMVGRFTAVFDTPVAGTSQVAGMFGGAENGMFFGYDYNDSRARFGVCVQSFGVRELRTLTVTVPSAGAETVTITLNGTGFNVSTTAGTAEATAQEIAEGTFSGWTAEADGDVVHFLADTVGAKSGSYTISSTGVTDGTFAQVNAGQATTEDWVYQGDWNTDTMDGAGQSAVTMDWTKGNVFQISVQYLGFGGIDFYVEDPETRSFTLVHRYEYANQRSVPTVGDPTFNMGLAVSNIATATDVSMSSASLAGFVEGHSVVLGPNHGTSASGNLATTSTAPILSIKNKVVAVDGISKVNLRELIMNQISCSASGSNKPLRVEVVLNGTLTNPLWTSYDSTHSFALVDTDATAITGGDIIFATGMASGSNVLEHLEDFDIKLSPGDIISVVLTTLGNAADYLASLSWREDV